MMNADGKKIALLGGARTGKDTIAHYLNAVYGHERFAFGDGIREVVHEVLFPHIPYEPKPRDIYIDLGQYCRSVYPDIWVDRAKRTYYSMKNVGIDHFVVTDVRQPNEIEWLQSEGFVFVRVVSEKQLERSQKLGEQLDLKNKLDNALNDFECLTIENNGTLDELYLTVDELMTYFGQGLEG